MNRAIAIGIGAVVAAAFSALVAGTLAPSTLSLRARCVPFPSGWVDDGGMRTVRFESVLMQRPALDLLGFPAGPSSAWADMEIQGYPALLPDGITPDLSQVVSLPVGVLRPEDDSTVSLRGSPLAPACQVAVRVSGTGGAAFRCACCTRGAAAGTCQVNLPAGGVADGVPALTYQPGVFVPGGSGLVPKPCVEIAGLDTSMPAACQ